MDDQQRVRLLAGVLRVAIALDRTRQRAVGGVHAEVGPDEVQVLVKIADGADASLELYTAQERSGLLADALGRPTTVAPTA